MVSQPFETIHCFTKRTLFIKLLNCLKQIIQSKRRQLNWDLIMELQSSFFVLFLIYDNTMRLTFDSNFCKLFLYDL